MFIEKSIKLFKNYFLRPFVFSTFFMVLWDSEKEQEFAINPGTRTRDYKLCDADQKY